MIYLPIICDNEHNGLRQVENFADKKLSDVFFFCPLNE